MQTTRAVPTEVMAADGRYLLVVGDGPGLESLVRDLRGHSRPVGVLADNSVVLPADWKYLGAIERLPDILRNGRPAGVALCPGSSDRDRIGMLTKMCMDAGIPAWLPLAIPREDREMKPRRAERAAKRLIDVAGSLAGMVILSPILLAAATAIAVTDGFPILFIQPRAGLHGCPFAIVKFRTMGRDADQLRPELRAANEIEGGASFKLASDPRVTPVGAILRRTSIDELPQLWNVLWGAMSLVGPRPHPYDDVAGYQPWQFRRLSVKPGMTGLWQVELRDDPDFDNWVRKDLEYIDTWSIWRDLTLIARTIPAVLRKTGR